MFQKEVRSASVALPICYIYIWHNNSVPFPRPRSHGQRSLAMCQCVHAFWEHSSDWSRGVPLRAHALAELSCDWSQRSLWRSTLHNAVCTQHCGLQGTREPSRGSRGWPRYFFLLLALRFHRNTWQVHVWVGREREQSWLGLGNHLLWALNIEFF